jgi:hypothetical protein
MTHKIPFDYEIHLENNFIGGFTAYERTEG